jgi:hypothetical protein
MDTGESSEARGDENQYCEASTTSPPARVLRACRRVSGPLLDDTDAVLLMALLRKCTEPSQKTKFAPWV